VGWLGSRSGDLFFAWSAPTNTGAVVHEVDEGLFTGTIESFNDESGIGVIAPDPGQGIEQQLYIHRLSFRDRATPLTTGTRVAFGVKSIEQGMIATDVHLQGEPGLAPESDSTQPAQGVSEQSLADAPSDQERRFGIVKTFKPDKGFGFITTDGQDIFFHVSALRDSRIQPVRDTRVSYRLDVTQRGPRALDVEVVTVEPSTSEFTSNWLARAILARDQRRYDEAAELYKEGFKRAPSVQLVLSWAAMEKNRRRRNTAMRVYEDGIAAFPDVAKLREDAGVLASSMGEYSKATRLLGEALDICRRTAQGGEKGVLLWLARTHYQADTPNSLAESARIYEEAVRTFDRGATQLPELDILAMNIARIRTQHHRGNLAVSFLRGARLEIVRARFLDTHTTGAEFVVRVDDPEFKESYGIGAHVVVRTMFKSLVSLSDLESLDNSVNKWASSGLADEQVAFLIVSSLPNELQALLSRRIEEKRRLLPAIVPIQQTDIETAPALVALRAALDRWLYRRDLFASGNNPVSGRRFFGRERPLNELRHSIASSIPTGIFGLRKVGKTSLLKEVQRRATQYGDIIVYLDLLSVPADVSDCSWLYWKLASDLRKEAEQHGRARPPKWRLGGEFDDFLDVPMTFPTATAFDADLRRLLEVLGRLKISPSPRVVILLDEVERLLPTSLGKPGFSGFVELFSYLRGVSQEHANFVLIVTAANSSITEAAQFGGRDNPVFNYFKEMYLQFLEESECVVMLRELGRGMGLQFNPAAVHRVYELTGGHPFFVRQLCSFVAAHHRERPLGVSVGMVDELADRYLDMRGDDFNEIAERLQRDFPDELAVCIALARSGGKMPARQLRDSFSRAGETPLKHLAGYQLVGFSGNDAFLTIELFARWLRKQFRDVSI
jgi:cold shock CspA family protein